MEQNTFEQEKKLLCLKYKVNFYLTVFLLHTNHSEGGYLFSQYIELLKILILHTKKVVNFI